MIIEMAVHHLAFLKFWFSIPRELSDLFTFFTFCFISTPCFVLLNVSVHSIYTQQSKWKQDYFADEVCWTLCLLHWHKPDTTPATIWFSIVAWLKIKRVWKLWLRCVVEIILKMLFGLWCSTCKAVIRHGKEQSLMWIMMGLFNTTK